MEIIKLFKRNRKIVCYIEHSYNHFNVNTGKPSDSFCSGFKTNLRREKKMINLSDLTENQKNAIFKLPKTVGFWEGTSTRYFKNTRYCVDKIGDIWVYTNKNLKLRACKKSDIRKISK